MSIVNVTVAELWGGGGGKTVFQTDRGTNIFYYI